MNLSLTMRDQRWCHEFISFPPPILIRSIWTPLLNYFELAAAFFPNKDQSNNNWTTGWFNMHRKIFLILIKIIDTYVAIEFVIIIFIARCNLIFYNYLSSFSIAFFRFLYQTVYIIKYFFSANSPSSLIFTPLNWPLKQKYNFRHKTACCFQPLFFILEALLEWAINLLNNELRKSQSRCFIFL